MITSSNPEPYKGEFNLLINSTIDELNLHALFKNGKPYHADSRTSF